MGLKTYELIITEMADGTILVNQNLERMNMFTVTGVLDKVRRSWLKRIDDDVRLQSDIQDVEYDDEGCDQCDNRTCDPS